MTRYYIERQTASGFWVPALASYPSATEAMLAAYTYLPASTLWRVAILK